MSVYKKYIFPYVLGRKMRQRHFTKERAQLIPQARGVVLEIGFGSGLNLPFYQGITKLYALEPNDDLWQLTAEAAAQASFPVEYIKASAEAVPLPDKLIDTVVCTWSLCSIPNPDKALAEARRVLQDDGIFIFVEHGLSPYPRIATWQARITPFWKKFMGGCHLDRDIYSLVNQAGFTYELPIEDNKQKTYASFIKHFYRGVVSLDE